MSLTPPQLSRLQSLLDRLSIPTTPPSPSPLITLLVASSTLQPLAKIHPTGGLVAQSYTANDAGLAAAYLSLSKTVSAVASVTKEGTAGGDAVRNEGGLISTVTLPDGGTAISMRVGMLPGCVVSVCLGEGGNVQLARTLMEQLSN